MLVEGSQSPEQKAAALASFRAGSARVMVTKASMAGWGLNLQHCARMVFVGLSDSYESYYQSIRRCWRFGQARPVQAHVVLTDIEEPIYQNVLRKQREHETMTAELVRAVTAYQRESIDQREHREDEVHAQPIRIPSWLKGAAA